MLRVYHSNRLDVLEALMEFIVERERLDDPFEPEMILVQSTGMAQWLQMTLSQKFGIAANIDFPLPASFIWDMFVRVLPEIPKESAFNKQSMSWKLMTLLPQLLEREDFTLLRHYLTDDSDKRKLFQLSSKAADLFDQYLVYRPEWLAQWETGHLVEGLGEAQARKRRCGRRWWNIPMNSDNRAGTAPISISALSKRWSPRRPARRGYLRASLYAVFPRYRLFISGRSGRWVNILKSISCLPTPAVITGAILKILLIWRNC